MSVTTFDNVWYAKILSQHAEMLDRTNADANSRAISNGIALAGAMISASIDQAFTENKDVWNVSEGLSNISGSLDRLAEVGIVVFHEPNKPE